MDKAQVIAELRKISASERKKADRCFARAADIAMIQRIRDKSELFETAAKMLEQEGA